MTISTTTSTITFAGDGSTTVFSFPFVGDSAATLQVFYTDSLGNITQLLSSQYTLFLNPAPSGGLWGIGGTVTYPNTGSPPTPITAGTFLTITRDVPFIQTVSINNQGAFYPQVVEQGMDLLELQIQQLNTDLAYTIKTPTVDLFPPQTLPAASQRANGYLAFNSSGQPIVLFGNVPQPLPLVGATTRKVSISTPTTINLSSADNFGGISIYQTGGAVATVQIPTGLQGPFPVFDGSVNASTFPITVLPPAGLTIQGQSNYILAFNGQSATFYTDGSQILIS